MRTRHAAGVCLVVWVVATFTSLVEAGAANLEQLKAWADKARSQGEWAKLDKLCDQILAVEKLSESDRGTAKRNKLTAVRGLGHGPDKVMALYDKLINDEKLSPRWALILKVDAAQYACAHDSTLEKGLEIADDGLAQIREMTRNDIKKRDSFLWSRWVLMTTAKANNLRKAKKHAEAAEFCYATLREMDQAQYATHLGMAVFLKGVRPFLRPEKGDKFFKAAVFAIHVVSRTQDAAKVAKLIKRLQLEGFDKAAQGKNRDKYKQSIKEVREALMGIADISFKNTEKGKAREEAKAKIAAVIALATAYAEKF